MANRTALFSRHQPGGVFTISDLLTHPGSIWFVDSATGTDGAGYGQNPDSPVATLDYAVGLCTASKGDVIYVMPGHTESISSATALTMDVAGVKVVGLGWGPLRPTFTVDTATTATWNVTAANCWIENVRIVTNFLNVAAAMTLSNAADGLTLKNILWKDTSVILGALIQLSVAAGVDDLTIDGNRFITTALTAAATQVINLAGAAHRLQLTNTVLMGACTGAVVAGTAAASNNIFIKNCIVLNTDTTAGLGMAFHNSTTGFVDDLTSVNLKNTISGCTGTGLSYGARCNYSNAVGAYAALFDVAADT